MPTTPKTQTRVEEFMDKRHPVMKKFSDLCKYAPGPNTKKKLWHLIEEDPFFLEPYVQLASLVMEGGKGQEARFIMREAYDRAISLITDQDGNWPEHISWDWPENRHILRAIKEYACSNWYDGRPNEALDIYRKLLRVSPGDAIEARFAILALRLGLGPDWEDGLEVTEEYDPEKWFRRNAKNFPEEFNWLFKEWRSMHIRVY